MKTLMIVDEVKKICRDPCVWRSVVSDYNTRDKARFITSGVS